MYISKLDLYISSLEIYKSSVKIQISYCMGKLFHRSCGIFCTDAVNFWQGGRKSREKKWAREAGYIYYNRCISMARSQPFLLEKRD